MDIQRARKADILAELDAHPFRSPWWAPGAHIQTLYPPLLRRPPAVEWRTERWATPDDDFLMVYSAGVGDRPAVLILHGLEGSVSSHYVPGLASKLLAAEFDVVVFEFRGCSDELNRARRMYHSGETTDLGFVVSRLLGERPERPLYLVGFSLGGNVVAKWLGELGDGVPAQIAGAAVVCPPFDLTVSGPHIDTVLFGAYTRHFLSTLVPKALAKEKQFPGCLDASLVRNCKTFAEFDTIATSPLHGFRDAQDYWERVSCGQFLAAIRRPTLLIAAADDPFNPGSTLPREVAEHSPFLHAQFPRRGGHVGFVYGWSMFHPRFWAEEQVLRFLRFYRERYLAVTVNGTGAE